MDVLLSGLGLGPAGLAFSVAAVLVGAFIKVIPASAPPWCG